MTLIFSNGYSSVTLDIAGSGLRLEFHICLLLPFNFVALSPWPKIIFGVHQIEIK